MLERWRFPVLVVLALCALLALYKPFYGGDVVEYALSTVAIADHGSPEIRLADIKRARTLLPDAFTGPLDQLQHGMRDASQRLYVAFVRGRDGDVFPVHYFGYSLLAAGPFKLFEALGVPPLKAFQVVNLLAVFALALALRRFFASEAKAWLGLGLFMLCGGALYLQWTSPECVSAALLLAGLLLYTSNAPLAGSVLAGLAGQQNPTILFFFVFAPLFKLLLDYERRQGLGANLRAQLTRGNLLGLAGGMAVFALPPLFNLWQFGVPNIIAKLFSDSGLIGAARLSSFYFDLNQGMIIGVPGLLLVLLLLQRRADGRARGALLLAALMALALAVPALAVLNWNSGATGPMRYAFWSAMPLVFALLVLLRRLPRWPQFFVAGLAATQALAMVHAVQYDHVHFSPAAVRMLTYAPQYYHPEPEIFAERVGNHDNYIQPDKLYTLQRDGVAVKTLAHASNAHVDEQLCGKGWRLAPDQPVVPSARGWRYLDGPLRCLEGALPQRTFQLEDMRAGQAISLASGWSKLEANGPGWNGAWSIGARSRLRIRLDGGAADALIVAGNYLAPNRETRIVVNGQDLGWHALDRAGLLALPAGARATTLDIELEHAAPTAPGPGDPRLLAFFLGEISVRQQLSKP